MKALQVCGHRENAVRARLKCRARAHARSLEGTLVLTVFCEFYCVIKSFSFSLYRFKFISVGNKFFLIDCVGFLNKFQIKFILFPTESKKGFSHPWLVNG